MLVAEQDLPEEARLEVLDLTARVTKPGDGEQHVVADSHRRAGREAEQVDTSGRHVLAKLSGLNRVPGAGELVEQLSMQQVHLAQVGLIGVGLHAGAVLDPGASVSVADQADARR